MAIFLIIFISIAMLHFIYEGLVLPTIRLNLRFRLFALRDELREYMITNSSDLDSKTFHCFQDSINTSLAFLHHIDLSTIIEVTSTFKKQEALSKLSEKRLAIMMNCKDERLQEIRNKNLSIFVLALLANSAVFFILFGTPLALIAYLFGKLKKVWYFTETTINNIICVPERDFDKLSKQTGLLYV